MDTHTTTLATDDARWRAVEARDASADGRFVYAVASTGVFCRPSCPSRRPKREGVHFFADGESAQAAGFRPCKRCRPLDADFEAAERRIVRAACATIAAADGESLPTLADLAEAARVSAHHLQRTFKRAMGLSPRQFAEALRIERFKAGVRNGESVSSALYGAGYGSPSRLYEKAGLHLGMTPAGYAKGGAGARIAFAIADSPLGRLLVAATERGICSVMLGDDDDFLEDELRGDYPAAEITRDDDALAGRVAAVLEAVRGNLPRVDLPLDVRATAFQWQVWERLRSIPAGEVRTYGEIAADLGRPAAARAVGRACATNPVSVIVPCHRAVGADGSLTGYRWGTARKRALIETEKRHKR